MLKKTFCGGVHPLHESGEGKPLSADCAIKSFSPGRVVLPVSMHLGAPSEPCVQAGDHVKIGQLIAQPVGGLGLPVHASISGTVSFVDNRQLLGPAPQLCIGIESDMRNEWVELMPLQDPQSASAADIIAAVKSAGICGMGGAAFPTHIKLCVPEGKFADTVILNGVECEPYLTADYRLMLESPERIVSGLALIMRATGVARGVIAIEDNKPEAITVMRKAISGHAGMEVAALKTKYPQGSEKQLIQAITGRQVPRGKLPVDAHALVFNVSTAAAISDAVHLGKPLVNRITTVTGCVARPGNFLLPIGTVYEDIIAECGGLLDSAAMLLAGGPMTAPCASNLSVVVTKANNGILALDEKQSAALEETPCIRCGRCVTTCPIALYPYLLRADIDKGDLDKAKDDGLMDCVLCGSCSYICPARRYLTPSFKAARDQLAAKGRK